MYDMMLKLVDKPIHGFNSLKFFENNLLVLENFN